MQECRLFEVPLANDVPNRRHTVTAVQFITGPTVGRTHFFYTFFKEAFAPPPLPGRFYTLPPVGLPSSLTASASFAARTPRLELCIVTGPSSQIAPLDLEIRQKLGFKKFSNFVRLKPASGHGLS